MGRRAALLASTILVTTFNHSTARAEQSPTDTGTLEEVTVTAQKRSENLQDVPLAVTAINADTLLQNGGQNVQGIEGLVPNVEINTSNAATGVAIRGIFSTNDSAQGDPAAAYHVDGVYLGRPQSVGGLLFDIDHIEVLRGPQGTLYGRNATAGAINIVTRRPTFQNEGQIGAEIGNYGLYGFSGVGNVTTGDKLAARLAFRTLKRDGFAVDERSDDLDSKSVRTEVLLNPTSDLSVLLAADYDSRQGVGSAAYRLAVPRVDPRSTNVSVPDAHIDSKNWGAHLELNWDLDFATLTMLPAYHHLDLDHRYASDRQIQWNQDVDQNSFEARLASSADRRLTWIVGAFYWEELQEYVQTLLPPPTTVRFGYTHIDSYSRAAFGQATLAFTDSLRVTAGLRYTDDRKKQNGSTQVRVASGALVSNIPNVADSSWNKLNWKATLEYDLAARSLLYATAATGYKAGGNYDGLAPNSYEPEEVMSYEVGSKNRLFGGALQLNVDVFRYGYHDYQASQLGCLNLPANLAPCSASGRLTYNADKAHVWGLEAEMQWAITPADRLNMVAAYTESEFDDFVLPVTPFSSGGDFSGNPLPKSPRTQVTLDFTHRFDLAGGGRLTAGARARHVSDQYLLFDIRSPITKQPAYEMGDVSLVYTAPKDRWEVSAYCNNVSDELVKSYAFAVSTPGVYYGTYLPPRTYGAKLQFNF
jgi:iron complex outermembrane receptor protein